jgi:hypothetical protein
MDVEEDDIQDGVDLNMNKIEDKNDVQKIVRE